MGAYTGCSLTSERTCDRARVILPLACCLLSLLFTHPAAPQALQTPDDVIMDHTFWSRYNMATVGAAGLAAGTIAYSAGVWWVNDYRPFSFTNAPWFEDKLGIDKIGHLYTSYFMFHALHKTLLWGGHSKNDAFWWAAGIAVFHGFVVEVGDGFSPFGFDCRDLAFNYSGLAYGILQEEVPFLKNFEIKWSLYYPLNKHSFKINSLYDYHIYWMSFRVNELIPRSWEPYWPDFLQIAFGLGADDNVTRRTYILSFDYNLELFPIHGRDASLLKKILNMFHLPAPGVKFSKGHAPEFQLLLLN